MDKFSRCAPFGMYRVTGYDMYDYSDYYIGDFSTLEEALKLTKIKISKPNGFPTSFSDVFFIYDDQDNMLYRGNHDEGIKDMIKNI